VEDNPANLFLVKRVARMGNHEVINFIDGEEALRKIDLVQPHLILMDIQLAGGLNGLEVVTRLRELGHTMPIIAVTAYAMVGDKERCLAAGCDDYMPKPIPVARLVDLFQRYQVQTEALARLDAGALSPATEEFSAEHLTGVVQALALDPKATETSEVLLPPPGPAPDAENKPSSAEKSS
jgi:CheY-like chemotaxis protein